MGAFREAMYPPHVYNRAEEEEARDRRDEENR